MHRDRLVVVKKEGDKGKDGMGIWDCLVVNYYI